MTGEGDRADDPAIWVNPADASKSLILGTNKDEGVYVYNLDGSERQRLMVGPSNNIDLRGTLAVASNDSVNGLSWFDIDPVTLEVIHLFDTPTGKDEPYGICAGMVGGVYHAATTYKDGTVQLWAAAAHADGELAPEIVRTVKLGSKLEGCVIDDVNARLFIGEEAVGVWSVDLADTSSAPVAIDTIAAGNGLVEDVEGMSLWLGDDGAGYLVVSAQEADRFVVYDRLPPHAPRGVITITESLDGSVDTVTHTDGLDVTSAALPGFPNGVLIVQDDANPASEVDQNFKVIDWTLISAALGL